MVEIYQEESVLLYGDQVASLITILTDFLRDQGYGANGLPLAE